MPKTQILGALLTVSGLPNFYPDMSQKPYAHIWALGKLTKCGRF